MTVDEFIKELRAFHPEAEVGVVRGVVFDPVAQVSAAPRSNRHRGQLDIWEKEEKPGASVVNLTFRSSAEVAYRLEREVEDGVS